MSAVAAKRSAVAAESQAQSARDQAAAAKVALGHMKEANAISAQTFWQSRLQNAETALAELASVSNNLRSFQETREAFSDAMFPNVVTAASLRSSGQMSLVLNSDVSDQVVNQAAALVAGLEQRMRERSSKSASTQEMVAYDDALKHTLDRILRLREDIPAAFRRREADRDRALAAIEALQPMTEN